MKDINGMVAVARAKFEYDAEERKQRVMPARPFLKWVGGKGRLVPDLLARMPSRYGAYYEPFVGGGALFFAASPHGSLYLSDASSELINLYTTIKTRVQDLIRELKGNGYVYDEKVFYAIRNETPSTAVKRAARTIYLNKTCFNGLYRVNRKGSFNVPFGRYTNPTILDEENLRACAHALRMASIDRFDFAVSTKGALKNDFVYFDPPYVPLSETSDFTKYTAGGFTAADQERLAQEFRRLASRGVYVMASNSDTPLVRRLYKGFNIEEVQVGRTVNSKKGARGKVGELIIRSYGGLSKGAF